MKVFVWAFKRDQRGDMTREFLQMSSGSPAQLLCMKDSRGEMQATTTSDPVHDAN